jgi:hypothetical protein
MAEIRPTCKRILSNYAESPGVTVQEPQIVPRSGTKTPEINQTAVLGNPDLSKRDGAAPTYALVSAFLPPDPDRRAQGRPDISIQIA